MKPIISVTLSLCALALTGCGKNVTAAPRATPVGVGTVRMREGGQPMKYSASLQPYDQVDLAFRASGYVENIVQVKGADGRLRSIQDGDHAARGQVLATLRANDYTARLQEAQAGLVDARSRLARADLDFGRASRLFASQSMTKPEFDAAKASYDSSRANLEAAQERTNQADITLRDTKLFAPFSGIIVKRNVTSGTLAGPGAPAFTVADISAVKAVFGVPDVVVARLKAGGRLELSTEAFPGEFFEGTVTRISAAADPRSRTFEVEVTVPNPRERLRIGMITGLEIPDPKPAAPVAVVPLSAIVSSTTPGAYAVYTLETKDQAQIARRREVKLGEAYGNEVAIVSGLRAGESVVIVGANLLNDGDLIQAVSAGVSPAR